MLQMKRLGRKTLQSSNRRRAAEAGQQDNVVPGRRTAERGVIDAESGEEVYGVLLSERRRMGESNPSVPAEKTQNTRSTEPKSVPKTGIAKDRKSK